MASKGSAVETDANADAAGQAARHGKELAERQARFRREWGAEQAKNDRYEGEPQDAKLTSFTQIRRIVYSLEGDSSIEDGIHLLHKWLWHWAKTNCVPFLDNARNVISSDAAELQQWLADTGVDVSLLNSKQGVHLKKLPALLLVTVVTNDIYMMMFDDPFFFFNAGGFKSANQKRHALYETLKLLEKRNFSSHPCFDVVLFI